VTTEWRRRAFAAAAVVLGALVVVWWAWPTFAGHDERLGVLVVGDSFLEPARRSIELQAREIGQSVRWERLDETWCTDPAAFDQLVDDADPEHVVLSSTTVERCAGVREDREAVAVVEPGSGSDVATLERAGYDVVDPERLVGRPGGDPRMECEWWETCDGDGRIAVRDDSGALTPAGNERVARMIVAAL
jgi:hypothetical protein